MLKQCRVRECRFGKYRVYLYHDGELISEKEYWYGEELDRYLEKLEAEGYVECYSPEEIEEAKKIYEYRSKHAVGGAPHWTGMEGDVCSECGRSALLDLQVANSRKEEQGIMIDIILCISIVAPWVVFGWLFMNILD